MIVVAEEVWSGLGTEVDDKIWSGPVKNKLCLIAKNILKFFHDSVIFVPKCLEVPVLIGCASGNMVTSSCTLWRSGEEYEVKSWALTLAESLTTSYDRL